MSEAWRLRLRHCPLVPVQPDILPNDPFLNCAPGNLAVMVKLRQLPELLLFEDLLINDRSGALEDILHAGGQWFALRIVDKQDGKTPS